MDLKDCTVQVKLDLLCVPEGGTKTSSIMTMRVVITMTLVTGIVYILLLPNRLC